MIDFLLGYAPFLAFAAGLIWGTVMRSQRISAWHYPVLIFGLYVTCFLMSFVIGMVKSNDGGPMNGFVLLMVLASYPFSLPLVVHAGWIVSRLNKALLIKLGDFVRLKLRSQ
ncbi:hypothetical protein [Labrenzia sp. VG12]|uniref:hypothetical protein n=1 Tax=Labrenzia sp. VG12 TaxID=2021862 RepID=UPI000B8C3DDC|nr:hypothetical protein [Labrenzia sp. VG12]ASP32223.1 hypothetical protein CHH27_02360 [Labrenzia sp. VG12]